jgi:hypothetical protein
MAAPIQTVASNSSMARDRRHDVHQRTKQNGSRDYGQRCEHDRRVTEGAAGTGGQATGTGTINLVCANVTTSGSNRLLLNFFGTCRGTSNTAAGPAEAWTDIYQTPSSSSLSLNPDIAASYQNAASAGAHAGETRTKQQTSSGDILWAGLSFAVIMA